MATFNRTQTHQLFEGRLASLENDAKRSHVPIPGTHPAPFSIMMYAFATIDYFSSCWAGWNEHRLRPNHDNRSQTDRMVDFLEKYLKYQRKESYVAVQIWRHKLMHTAEPRILRDANSPETYSWFLYGGTVGFTKDRHWAFARDGSNTILSIAIPYLVSDLTDGVLGSNGYFDELCKSVDLQRNFENFQSELNGYTLDL